MFQFATVIDLVASTGLIVVLGFFYAQCRRWKQYPRAGEYGLGLIFGVAAIFQMYRPFEPIDGLIIDLRNIPVVLAGAFLGWRGILVCVTMTVGMRLNLGGGAMTVGVFAVLTAAAMGILWAKWTDNLDRRGVKLHITLAVMLSTHLLWAFLLPAEMRNWFLSEAALTILLINLTVVPVVATILEVERRKFNEETRLRNSVVLDPESGLLTPEAFARACEVRASAMGDTSYTRALVIRMRTDSWLESWTMSFSPLRLLAAVRVRVQDVLPQANIAGVYGQQTLLVPLTQDNLIDFDDVATKIRRFATDEAYGLPGNISVHVALEMEIVEIESAQGLAKSLTKLRFGSSKGQFDGVREKVQKRASKVASDQLKIAAAPISASEGMRVDKLFRKAELLMEANSPKRRRFSSGALRA